MSILKKFFDDFTFRARVMPILTALLPVILLGFFKGYIFKDFFDISIYCFFILIFCTFASKVARELGKKYEEKMYSKLGEKPTTIALRFSDNTIDKVTKVRYHRIINDKLEGIILPLSASEESSESDSMYQSAITIIRNYANDNRNTEPRVYQELKEYNYWRNLYGCKWISITFYVLIAVREIYMNSAFSLKEIIVKPYPEYIAFLLMILGIVGMCLCVNEDTVKRKAFDYAKTLIEVCERIKQKDIRL